MMDPSADPARRASKATDDFVNGMRALRTPVTKEWPVTTLTHRLFSGADPVLRAIEETASLAYHRPVSKDHHLASRVYNASIWIVHPTTDVVLVRKD